MDVRKERPSRARRHRRRYEPVRPRVAARVAASVRRTRESGLLPDDYALYAFVYDVATWRLEPVET